MEDDARLPGTCVSNGHPAWREAMKNRWETGWTASVKARRTTWRRPDYLTARCIYTTRHTTTLSVCAYLLLIRLYGRDEASGQPWSLFRLKERFQADLMRQEIDRTERKWQRKLKQYEDAAWFFEDHPSLLRILFRDQHGGKKGHSGK